MKQIELVSSDTREIQPQQRLTTNCVANYAEGGLHAGFCEVRQTERRFTMSTRQRIMHIIVLIACIFPMLLFGHYDPQKVVIKSASGIEDAKLFFAGYFGRTTIELE